MRTLTFGLIGAAALAAGLFIVREVKDDAAVVRGRDTPAGESQPATISLERIRELGY